MMGGGVKRSDMPTLDRRCNKLFPRADLPKNFCGRGGGLKVWQLKRMVTRAPSIRSFFLSGCVLLGMVLTLAADRRREARLASK